MTPDPPRLSVADVAALFTEAGYPVTSSTVSWYVSNSVPDPDGRRQPRSRRYADNPIPMPLRDDRGRPYWQPEPGQTLDDVKAALLAWRRSLPGRGAGGGRPYADGTPPVHRLSGIDPDAHRAVCEHCGPVKVIRTSVASGKWRCQHAHSAHIRAHQERRRQLPSARPSTEE